jgi:hypothetical protein
MLHRMVGAGPCHYEGKVKRTDKRDAAKKVSSFLLLPNLGLCFDTGSEEMPKGRCFSDCSNPITKFLFCYCRGVRARFGHLPVDGPSDSIWFTHNYT